MAKSGMTVPKARRSAVVRLLASGRARSYAKWTVPH